eukprot:g17628.t1
MTGDVGTFKFFNELILRVKLAKILSLELVSELVEIKVSCFSQRFRSLGRDPWKQGVPSPHAMPGCS